MLVVPLGTVVDLAHLYTHDLYIFLLKGSSFFESFRLFYTFLALSGAFLVITVFCRLLQLVSDSFPANRGDCGQCSETW